MNTQLLLGMVASILGIWYSVLGLRAIQFLQKADAQDRSVGWSLWWCLDGDRYDEPGKRLCKWGLLLATASIVIWAMVFMVKWV